MICSVDGCEKPIKSTKLCSMHKRRMELTGKVGPAGPVYKTHILTDCNVQLRKAICSVCGPVNITYIYLANWEGWGCLYRLRDTQIRALFKLDITDLRHRLDSQSWCCCICKQSVDEFSPVDHDHSCCPNRTTCGKCIRGILCKDCNLGLGRFKDNPEFLLHAAEYLMNEQRA